MSTAVLLRGHLLAGDAGGSCTPGCGTGGRAQAAPFELGFRNGSEQYAAVRSGEAEVQTLPGEYVPLPVALGLTAVELLAVRSSAPITLRVNGTGARARTQATWPLAALAGTRLTLELDGSPLTVDFLAGDDTPEEAARRLNGAAVLAGLTYLPARVVGGQVELEGGRVGPLGTLGSFGDAAAALLGLSGASVGAGSELAVDGVALLQFRRTEGVRRIDVSGAARLSVLAAGS